MIVINKGVDNTITNLITTTTAVNTDNDNDDDKYITNAAPNDNDDGNEDRSY